MPASVGIFFVVRLPTEWQLCSLRFADYGLVSFRDAWPDLCGTLLGLWVSFLRKAEPLDASARFSRIQQALPQFIEGADAFPRGWVSESEREGRFEIHHGGDLTRAMHVTRREVEASFEIAGRARWIERPVLAHAPGRMELFRDLLAPEQAWLAAPSRAAKTPAAASAADPSPRPPQRRK